MEDPHTIRWLRNLGRPSITAIAVAALLMTQAGSGVAAPASQGPKECGPLVLEGTLSIPTGQGVHRVVRITEACTAVIESENVVSAAEANRLNAADPVPNNRAALPGDPRSPKGPGLKSPMALVAGGPLHMKLRLLDAIGLDVTSINPHDLSYGYNGSTVTSYSHSAYQTWATDNSGFCGTGYYGWHPANGSLTVSGGGIGYTFIDSLAHAEFWYQGIFRTCDQSYYYNILDTKLTGFGNGSPSSCAYRLYLAQTAFGWHTDLLCWDAYSSTTPAPF